MGKIHEFKLKNVREGRSKPQIHKAKVEIILIVWNDNRRLSKILNL